MYVLKGFGADPECVQDVTQPNIKHCYQACPTGYVDQGAGMFGWRYCAASPVPVPSPGTLPPAVPGEPGIPVQPAPGAVWVKSQCPDGFIEIQRYQDNVLCKPFTKPEPSAPPSSPTAPPSQPKPEAPNWWEKRTGTEKAAIVSGGIIVLGVVLYAAVKA